MASGDITASTPVEVEGSAAIKVAVDALNLAAVTDIVQIIPVNGRDNSYLVFKTTREA